MIQDIIKSIFGNFQKFLVVWLIVLIANQLFIFGACFAPYCLIAALPHTGIVAALVHFFLLENESSNSIPKKAEYEKLDEDINKDDFEEFEAPFCPKCGSKMVLRTAKKGRYAGEKFWGCTKYPSCTGVLKV